MNEPGFLGDVNELRGRGDTAVRLAPAQQRLQPRYFKRVQRDLGLEHQQQIAGLDRLA